MPTPVAITSEQALEVSVSGPDDISRLYVVTGIATPSLVAAAGDSGMIGVPQAPGRRQGTFEAYVGPTLNGSEFRRAVATASLASLQASGDTSFFEWSVTGVDAHFDDDEERVRLQFDLSVGVGAGTSWSQVLAAGVGVQVLILAASAS
jgi:hypothetical protein